MHNIKLVVRSFGLIFTRNIVSVGYILVARLLLSYFAVLWTEFHLSKRII